MSVIDLTKKRRWKSKKYLDAAQGQPCTMRIPGVCNGNPETTVFAHNNGAGVGIKADDWDGADMCSSCHDVFDGRAKSQFSRKFIDHLFSCARLDTLANRLERGILN